MSKLPRQILLGFADFVNGFAALQLQWNRSVNN